MRIVLFTHVQHSLGRVHRALAKLLREDGHRVDVVDWSNKTYWLRDNLLKYDLVISTTLITSCGLDMANPHVRARLVAIAHIGVYNTQFREELWNVFASTPIAAVGAVSPDARDYFHLEWRITQPLTYTPCGVDLSEFPMLRSLPTAPIRRLGFVGLLHMDSNHPDYNVVKRPQMFLDLLEAMPWLEGVEIWGRDTNALYTDVDLVVCTSSVEGGPLGILEAAASGVPVLSTRVGNVACLKSMRFFNIVEEAVAIIAEWNANLAALQAYTAAVTTEVRTRFNWDALYAKHWRPMLQACGPKGAHLTYLELGMPLEGGGCAHMYFPDDAFGYTLHPDASVLSTLPERTSKLTALTPSLDFGAFIHDANVTRINFMQLHVSVYPLSTLNAVHETCTRQPDLFPQCIRVYGVPTAACASVWPLYQAAGYNLDDYSDHVALRRMW